MKAGQTAAADDIRIRAIEAYNLPANHPDKVWHQKGNGIGYLLTAGGRTIYHAGDTDFIPEMKALGPVDIALLPIGGTFTMGLDEAVEATLAIRPKVVISMHARDADPEEFKKKVESALDIEVALLQVGDALTIE